MNHYVDSYSLYGHPMTQLPPIKMLDLIDPEKTNLEDGDPIGCFFQFDCDYPDDLTIKVTMSIKYHRRLFFS